MDCKAIRLKLQDKVSKSHPAQPAIAVKVLLVILFSILWAMWMQPHTIGLRHALLSIGSILGLYVVSKDFYLLKTKSSLPIYLIGILMVWVSFHLLFLAHQYDSQLAEYLTIWKRILWGAPFAIGLGMAMQSAGDYQSNRSNWDRKKNKNNKFYVWWIFYVGMAMPTFIYLLRAVLMFTADKLNFLLPEFAVNLYPPSTWYIPKTSYVFFCLPILAISCGELICLAERRIKPALNLFFNAIFFTSTIISVLLVFYFENIKNGIAYSFMLISVLLLKIFLLKKSPWSWRDGLATFIVIALAIFLLVLHVKKNDSWRTLVADIKVAENVEQVDSWKYDGAKGYPKNELGMQVFGTNYERASWARVALNFISELPMGYGLVHGSFGKFAQEKWPDSRLTQSHSGWLDLTLGIGVPGLFLLVLAGLISARNVSKVISHFWSIPVLWLISSIALLMITTEVSQRVYIEALIFLILWMSGLGLHRSSGIRLEVKR
jgi:hypothetical protein